MGSQFTEDNIASAFGDVQHPKLGQAVKSKLLRLCIELKLSPEFLACAWEAFVMNGHNTNPNAATHLDEDNFRPYALSLGKGKKVQFRQQILNFLAGEDSSHRYKKVGKK